MHKNLALVAIAGNDADIHESGRGPPGTLRDVCLPPFHRCGVVETVVEAVSVARKDRTAFFGVVADGENVIVRPVCELVYALRT